MSTTVTYKGATLTTAENQTRVLNTAGKLMEDDVTITDVTSGGGVTVNPLSVTANGTYTAPTGEAYSPVTVNVPSSGDDPYPVRNDGKTHLWVLVDDLSDTTVILGTRQSASNAIIYDWGDGTVESFTGTSLTRRTHTYLALGLYEIVLSAGASGYWYMRGNNGSIPLFPTLKNASRLLAAEFVPIGAGTVPTGQRGTSAYTFYGCTNLKKLTFAEGMTTINKPNAANNYFGFENIREITLPSTITYIQSQCFKNATKLQKITLPIGITTSQTSANVFEDCADLQELEIPSGLWTSIDSFTLGGCTSLRKLIIPANIQVTMNGFVRSDASFDPFTKMRIFDVKGLTGIRDNMFMGNVQMASITIYENVASIGENAFSGCVGMAEIHFKPTTPPTVADANAWTSLPTTCKIYVPSGTLSAYTSAANYPDPATYTYVEE